MDEEEQYTQVGPQMKGQRRLRVLHLESLDGL